MSSPTGRSSVAAIQHDAHAGAALDLVGSSPGPHRGRVDLGVARREPFRRVAVPVEPRVPDVDVRERDRQHPRTAAADHQRRSPRGRREQHGVVHAAVPSVERDAFSREQPADDLERLLEPRDAVIERHTERVELRSVPSCPEAEDETSAADLVDRRGHLREHGRLVEAGARDQRPQSDALGHRRETGQQGPGFPGSALGPTVVAVQEVVTHPHRVEPDVLGRASHGDVLGPTHLAFDLRKLHTDAKGSRRRRRDQPSPIR